MATIHAPVRALFRGQNDWQGSLKVGPNFTSIKQSKSKNPAGRPTAGPLYPAWLERVKAMISRLLAILIAVLATASVGESMDAVTIQGKRFYSGAGLYFPATHFLTAIPKSSHVYLSHKLDTADRQKILTDLNASGYNSIFLYLLNQGDYHSRSVTPYQNLRGIIGGDFNETTIANWRAELLSMIAQNIRPVLWLFADDSEKIRKAPVDELKRFIEKMTTSFDDLPIMWVLGLEVDEYWSKAQADDLGSYLKRHAVNPVGIHQRSYRTDYMVSPWVDYGVYQTGFTGSWLDLYNDALAAQAQIGKPLLFAEYQKGGSFTATQEGLAAAFAGSAGVGNGAPVGLAEFIAKLPDNMVPSRSGNILTLTGSGIVAHANMTTLEFIITKTK